jgi:hypothetical protein
VEAEELAPSNKQSEMAELEMVKKTKLFEEMILLGEFWEWREIYTL